MNTITRLSASGCLFRSRDAGAIHVLMLSIYVLNNIMLRVLNITKIIIKIVIKIMCFNITIYLRTKHFNFMERNFQILLRKI